MKLTNKTRLSNIVLILTCVVIIATSALDTMFHFPKLNLLTEKRTLEKLPNINRISFQGIASRSVSLSDHLQSYILDVVKHYNDNFGLRGLFCFLNNAIKVFAFNTSPNNQVVIGNMDWLYFADNFNLEYYRNSKSFTVRELIATKTRNFWFKFQVSDSNDNGKAL